MANSKPASTASDSVGKKSLSTVRRTLDRVLSVLFHLRKILMALPVIYFAFKIAFYNDSHLPTEVGLFLQNNGNFLRMIDRNTAVLFPLVITLGCLTLMLFSRKAMYAWAISIFSLALPLLILFSNLYPA